MPDYGFKFTFTLRKRRNAWGEYVVRCWKDGKRYPDGDYFTDDWDDAQGTMKHMTDHEAQRLENQP